MQGQSEPWRLEENKFQGSSFWDRKLQETGVMGTLIRVFALFVQDIFPIFAQMMQSTS
jgi:hypothetical protein